VVSYTPIRRGRLSSSKLSSDASGTVLTTGETSSVGEARTRAGCLLELRRWWPNDFEGSLQEFPQCCLIGGLRKGHNRGKGAIPLDQLFQFRQVSPQVADIRFYVIKTLSHRRQSRLCRRSFIRSAPLREKRAARVLDQDTVQQIATSTPTAYHGENLSLAPPDRDDGPNGTGHARTRSRMPDLEWLPSSDEGWSMAWMTPFAGARSPDGIRDAMRGGSEHRERWIRSRRMEEGRQIDQEVRGEFERARHMIHHRLVYHRT